MRLRCFWLGVVTTIAASQFAMAASSECRSLLDDPNWSQFRSGNQSLFGLQDGSSALSYVYSCQPDDRTKGDIAINAQGVNGHQMASTAQPSSFALSVSATSFARALLALFEDLGWYDFVVVDVTAGSASLIATELLSNRVGTKQTRGQLFDVLHSPTYATPLLVHRRRAENYVSGGFHIYVLVGQSELALEYGLKLLDLAGALTTGNAVFYSREWLEDVSGQASLTDSLSATKRKVMFELSSLLPNASDEAEASNAFWFFQTQEISTARLRAFDAARMLVTAEKTLGVSVSSNGAAVASFLAASSFDGALGRYQFTGSPNSVVGKVRITSRQTGFSAVATHEQVTYFFDGLKTGAPRLSLLADPVAVPLAKTPALFNVAVGFDWTSSVLDANDPYYRVILANFPSFYLKREPDISMRTNLMPTAPVSNCEPFARSFLNTSNAVLVGPVFSTCALSMEQPMKGQNTVSISFAAFSTALADQDRFPFFFRTISSQIGENEALVQLLITLRAQCLTIGYNPNLDIFVESVAYIEERLNEFGIEVNLVPFTKDSVVQAAQDIQATQTRVIMVSALREDSTALVQYLFGTEAFGQITWVFPQGGAPNELNSDPELLEAITAFSLRTGLPGKTDLFSDFLAHEGPVSTRGLAEVTRTSASMLPLLEALNIVMVVASRSKHKYGLRWTSTAKEDVLRLRLHFLQSLRQINSSQSGFEGFISPLNWLDPTIHEPPPAFTIQRIAADAFEQVGTFQQSQLELDFNPDQDLVCNLNVAPPTSSASDDNQDLIVVAASIGSVCAVLFVIVLVFAAKVSTSRLKKSLPYDFSKELDKLDLVGPVTPPREVSVKRIRELGQSKYHDEEELSGNVVLFRENNVPEFPVMVRKLAPSASSRELNAFYEEVAYWAQFSNHVNILSLIGVVTTSREKFAFSYYCPHGTLADFLRTSVQHADGAERLTVRSKLQLALGIATGMEHIASRSGVHGDLRAATIWVDAPATPKIGGFAAHKDMKYYSMKIAEAAPLRWWSVERLCGDDSSPTPADDIWHFGITLFEIMTNAAREPYPDYNVDELKNSLQKGKRLLRPTGCSPPIYGIMKLCWLEDITSRPRFEVLKFLIDTELQRVADAPPRSETGPAAAESMSPTGTGDVAMGPHTSQGDSAERRPQILETSTSSENKDSQRQEETIEMKMLIPSAEYPGQTASTAMSDSHQHMHIGHVASSQGNVASETHFLSNTPLRSTGTAHGVHRAAQPAMLPGGGTITESMNSHQRVAGVGEYMSESELRSKTGPFVHHSSLPMMNGHLAPPPDHFRSPITANLSSTLYAPPLAGFGGSTASIPTFSTVGHGIQSGPSEAQNIAPPVFPATGDSQPTAFEFGVDRLSPAQQDALLARLLQQQQQRKHSLALFSVKSVPLQTDARTMAPYVRPDTIDFNAPQRLVGHTVTSGHQLPNVYSATASPSHSAGYPFTAASPIAGHAVQSSLAAPILQGQASRFHDNTGSLPASIALYPASVYPLTGLPYQDGSFA